MTEYTYFLIDIKALLIDFKELLIDFKALLIGADEDTKREGMCVT